MAPVGAVGGQELNGDRGEAAGSPEVLGVTEM